MKMLVTFASGQGHKGRQGAKFAKGKPMKQKGIGGCKCLWLSLQGIDAKDAKEQRPQSEV